MGSPTPRYNHAEGTVLVQCNLGSLMVPPHGHTLLLLIKQEQSENLPDDQMALKTGWKVSQLFLLLLGNMITVLIYSSVSLLIGAM